jgi:HK97 family phage portal protein
MGLPEAYLYEFGGNKVRYQVDQVKGHSPVLHMKTFHPTDDWYGMSPIEAAVMSVDNHNEAGLYNLALMQNKATPSGALVVSVSDKNPSGKLDDEQYKRLQAKLEEKFVGSHNAGRPMLLEGGLDWREMGLSPKDMEYILGKNMSAREIALAFGYPPILLGIPGDSTYNNQKEARLALYEDTVLPTMDFLVTELNNWLAPAFGEGLVLDYDRDSIDAIAVKREAVWARVKDADFLTDNEKREAVGYEPLPGGDTLYKDATKIPIDLLAEGVSNESSSGRGSNSDGNDDSESDDPGDDDPDPADEGKSANSARTRAIEHKAAENRFSDFVNRFVDRYAGDRVTGIQRTSKKRVTEAIRDAIKDHIEEGTNLNELSVSIQAEVESVYKLMSEGRARTIARTETTVASNEGSRAAASALGLPNMLKEWVSADDSRTRGADADDATNHMKMNGTKIPMHEKFMVPSVDGPDEMDGPGDKDAPADQVVNCRCVLVYEAGEEKSINLSSQAAKRRHIVTIARKRATFERSFAAQITEVFKREGEGLVRALAGVTDQRSLERVIDVTLENSASDFKRVFRANVAAIMKDFGGDVLKQVG